MHFFLCTVNIYSSMSVICCDFLVLLSFSLSCFFFTEFSLYMFLLLCSHIFLLHLGVFGSCVQNLHNSPLPLLLFVSVVLCTVFHLEFEYSRHEILRNLILFLRIVVIQDEEKLIEMKLGKLYCCSRLVLTVL